MKFQLRNAVRVYWEYVPVFYETLSGSTITFNKPHNSYFKYILDILNTQRERLEALEYLDGEVILYEIKDITPDEEEAAQYINKIHNDKSNVEKVNAIEKYTTMEDGDPFLSRVMYYFRFDGVGYCFESDLVKIDPENETEPELENEPKNDPVNSPSHYTYGKIEVIDYILDKHLDFCLGNVIKYVSRAGHKNNALEDLQKAAKYLEFKINELKAKESE